MGRTKEEKLADYVREGAVPKVKAFLKKHRRVDVNKSADHKHRTLLHLVCANGDDATARLLLKYGADPALQDDNGDTALHVALQKVLHGYRHAFPDLVIPILKYSARGSLDLANKRGRTPRQLLEEADYKLEKEEEAELADQQRRRSGTSNDERSWQDKLFDEWQGDFCADDEYFPFWQGHHTGPGTGPEFESYDDWADRLSHEHRQKHRTEMPSTSSSKHKKRESRKSHHKHKDDTKEKFAWERSQKEHRKSERLQTKLIQQKENYLRRCQKAFDTVEDDLLHFDDVPWPKNSKNVESMIQVLMCDINKENQHDFKKFLRTQQLIWHPDKFMQKFGQRLVPEDKDKILERVTSLSQALNRINDEERKP
ncbi:NF-kappa-B inhibitor-like protein 1 [Amphiura filiformis]|uniref:NF-kappa-B inhibitor-like protein 1 n=1 Tax=Amphiura filiformis TaxID=82378 RepID=UPI003B228C1B